MKTKRARRLTLKEKKLLSKQGYDPKSFLRINRTAEYYEFLEVSSGKVLALRR